MMNSIVRVDKNLNLNWDDITRIDNTIEVDNGINTANGVLIVNTTIEVIDKVINSDMTNSMRVIDLNSVVIWVNVLFQVFVIFCIFYKKSI